MNIRNKTLSQLLDIVDGNVDVHLLLGSLHEVVFRQPIVDNLLVHLTMIRVLLLLHTYRPNVH